MDRQLSKGKTIGPELAAGARNLLENCVGLAAGERVLIVGEDHDRAFFDPEICHVIATAVEEFGGRPRVVIAPATSGPEEFPDDIAALMRGADHTLFFSRLGDQVRFCPLPGNGSKTMCYLHDVSYLKDEFAQVPYGLFAAVNDLLLQELEKKTTCSITCNNSTDLSGSLKPKRRTQVTGVTDEFSVRLFPVMIIPPLSGSDLSGTLALGRWLMTTSTRSYEQSLIELQAPLVAHVEAGKITRFSGDASEVGRVQRHFRRVARISGGDPFAVNSWHTGTNPKTFYAGRAQDNVEKWSDIAYGSPRYTHFHVCGGAPGDIAISLIDATVAFDGEAFWQAGRFRFLERADAIALAKRYTGGESAFEMRYDIGL